MSVKEFEIKVGQKITMSIITKDSHIENMFNMIKEVSENIQNDLNKTVFVFVDGIMQTQFLQACIARIISSPLNSSD
jgi:hemoglobin-like flavoprotein